MIVITTHFNLLNKKKYVIQDEIVNIENIQRILDETRIEDEPKIPFPQADSFDRVINLCELLHNKITLTKEEITRNYDFDARQSDYYSNAGRYLGLVEYERENDMVICCLTEKGRNLFKLSIFYRQIEFVKLILSHAAFNNTLKLYFKNGNIPTKQEIIKIMHRSDIWNIDSESTYLRRSSTIISWINWIIDPIEE
jgi:hypothetical protein